MTQVMTWVLGKLALPAGPWLLIGAAVVLIGIGFTAGRYSAAVTVANQKVATAVAHTETANVRAARATDTANANGATAQSLSTSASRAAAADDTTARVGQVRATGYATAQEGANHAQPSQVCVDAHPLRVFFDGLRDADRAAAGTGSADRAGGP